MTTEQMVEVPEHPPVQRTKWEPADGVAVSVTVVPSGKSWLHVEPHAMPTGELAITPPTEEVVDLALAKARVLVLVTPARLAPLEPLSTDKVHDACVGLGCAGRLLGQGHREMRLSSLPSG